MPPFILLTLIAVSTLAQAQPPRDAGRQAPASPVGTASISGAVVVAGSGLPARKVRVSLSGAELRGNRTATTDEQGRFLFSALPAGRYSLSASKPGHVSVTYGQRQPGVGRQGTPIELTEGQKFDARLSLPRGGVITGTILDELGEATPGTPVRVLRYAMQAGARVLQNSATGSTDDRGVFRVYGLQPGDYVVCATPRNSVNDLDRLRMELTSLTEAVAQVAQRDPRQAEALEQRVSQLQALAGQRPDDPATGYAPVCYPGTTVAASASPVTLGVSEERAGIDFPLQLVPLAHIEGMVVNPTGAPLANLQVTLVSTADVPGFGNSSARPDSEGRFRIANVPPGQYTLVARANVRSTAQGAPAGRGGVLARPTETVRIWAAADISVDGRPLSNLVLSLQPGVTVSGHVAFAGTSQQVPADLTRARVSLSPISTGAALRGLATGATGRVDATGRFTIANVMPGRYRLTGSAGANGWTVESAVLSGQDTADFPVDIKGDQNISGATLTFTDRQTELSGTVVDERNQPATEYTVIVFPADQRYWTPATRRIRSARPATSGQFSFRSLPPGDYRIGMVIDPEPGIWLDPAFLEQLETASLRVALGPGEKKVQHLRVPGS